MLGVHDAVDDDAAAVTSRQPADEEDFGRTLDFVRYTIEYSKTETLF